MKFSLLYEELKFSDVFSKATPEEVAKRKEQYAEKIIEDAKKTKLPDGTWHVHESIELYSMEINSLKTLNISIVDGRFDCSHNNLTSLEGCPKEIGEMFICNFNSLTSLNGCAKKIGQSFYCNKNKLTSLVGGPEYVGYNYDCSNNLLTSLDGVAEYIGGSLVTAFNPTRFSKDELNIAMKRTVELNPNEINSYKKAIKTYKDTTSDLQRKNKTLQFESNKYVMTIGVLYSRFKDKTLHGDQTQFRVIEKHKLSSAQDYSDALDRMLEFTEKYKKRHNR